MLKQFLIAAVCFSFGCAPVLPSSENSRKAVASAREEHVRQFSQRVDSIVRAGMANRRVVGAAVAVFDHGLLVKSAAYGTANLATGEFVTPRTAFFVASISKTISAAAAMTLVDDDRAALDDSIGSLLPGAPVEWRGVTLRHLLTHTSGLPDVVIGPGQYIPTYELALEQLGSTPLRVLPGTQVQYTQTNWALVAKIIEARSGRSFEDYVSRRVFAPLGIQSPTFGSYDHVGQGRAEWYSTASEASSGALEFNSAPHLLRTEYRAYLHAADGLWISAEDLARWVDALSRGLVVKPTSLALTWTRVSLPGGSESREGFGGWIVNRIGEETQLVSEGGARAGIVHVRERGLTVAVLTNTQGAAELRWMADIVDAYEAAKR